MTGRSLAITGLTVKPVDLEFVALLVLSTLLPALILLIAWLAA
jgi:hypothetical protein